uniref:Uncharacterized protein n=2 Tax=Zea mays TaxID=4577 RepID=A0A804LJ93_MAIZE
MEATMKLCNVATVRSSVTGKPREQEEVSSRHEDQREPAVIMPPGASVHVVSILLRISISSDLLDLARPFLDLSAIDETHRSMFLLGHDAQAM